MAATPRLYLGNLPPDTAFPDIHSLCAPFGKVTSIELKDGLAFVDFADATVVANVIQAFHGMLGAWRWMLSLSFQARTSTASLWWLRTRGSPQAMIVYAYQGKSVCAR